MNFLYKKKVTKSVPREPMPKEPRINHYDISASEANLKTKDSIEIHHNRVMDYVFGMINIAINDGEYSVTIDDGFKYDNLSINQEDMSFIKAKLLKLGYKIEVEDVDPAPDSYSWWYDYTFKIKISWKNAGKGEKDEA